MEGFNGVTTGFDVFMGAGWKLCGGVWKDRLVPLSNGAR